jgi:uncharacterized protein (TIGR00251 family)
MIHCAEESGAITFAVRVIPRAKLGCLAGEHDGALRVRVTAPPVDGAANEELVRTLARALSVPPRAVQIIAGHSSKLKRVRVSGISRDLLAKLTAGK